MKFLLDTHVWLWTLREPERLNTRCRNALRAPGAELWLSPLSIFEGLQAVRRGRVQTPLAPMEWLQEALTGCGISEAAVSSGVAQATLEITLHHRDPIDILLAATARAYELTLVTADRGLLDGGGYSSLRAD